MSWTIKNNTGIDETPFLTDPYPNIKHNFYRNGVYFIIFLTWTDATYTDLSWAWSYDGQNYTLGGDVYQNYGSANEFYVWYDGANKVYVYRHDWDAGGHCIQIGTISGNTITFGAKKNVETTGRWLEGICKTSNGRLWVIFIKTSSPYRLYVKYSDDEGDTWSTTTEVSNMSNVNWNASVGVVPLDSSHVYIIYECYGSNPPMMGRYYDGSSFGSEEDTNIDYIRYGTHPVCDGTGRVHMLSTNRNRGEDDVYHNWRSVGLSGSWQITPEIIKHGDIAWNTQLIKNGNNIRAYYLDYLTDHFRLYCRDWDGSWGTEINIGNVEEDPVNKAYYYSSFRIPYSFDGNNLHITFTWQLYTTPSENFTTLGAGQYNGGVGGPMDFVIGDYDLDLTDVPIFDVSLEQNCDVATRDVPLRSAGEIMDTGTYVINTLTLSFSLRLTNSEKTTLESMFISHGEATVYLKRWKFIGWFRGKSVVYEALESRKWKVDLKFDIYSYTYS